MYKRRTASIIVAGLAALSFSASAMAQHHGGHASGSHHFHGGPAHFNHFHHSRVFIGGTFFAPFYYPPYYYDPYAYYEPPVQYVQPAAPQPWYYCASARTYYPYVQSCPEGWQQVLPPQQ